MLYLTTIIFGLIIAWAGWTWIRDRSTRKNLAQGEQALQNGLLDQAAELFLVVLRDDKKQRYLRSLADHHLGQVIIELTKQGKFAEAEALSFRRVDALADLSDDAEWKCFREAALVQLGGLLAIQGKDAEADHVYKKHVAPQGRAGSALHCVGWQLTGLTEIVRLSSRSLVSEPEFVDIPGELNRLVHACSDAHGAIDVERVGQRTLAIFESHFGHQHPHVIFALEALGDIYQGLNRFDESERYYRQALALQETALGSDESSLADREQRLAGFLVEQGRFAEAEPLYRRSVEKQYFADKLRPAYFRRAQARLADLHRIRGQAVQAEHLCRNGLEFCQAHLGEDALETILAKHSLALTLIAQFRMSAAQDLLEQCKVGLERFRPEHNLTYATILGTQAKLLYGLGRFDQAEPVIQESWHIQQKILNPSNPGLVPGLDFLGTLAHFRGNFPRSEHLHRQALSLVEQEYGHDHHEGIKSLMYLAVLARDQAVYLGESAQLDQAQSWARRALSTAQRTYGPEAPLTAVCMGVLARVLSNLGQHTEAEELAKNKMGVTARAHTKDHPSIGSTEILLAEIMSRNGSLSQALAHGKQGLKNWQNAYGSENIQIAHPAGILAIIHGQRGELTEAESLCRQALQLREKTLGAEHPNVVINLQELADLLKLAEREEEVRTITARALTLRQRIAENWRSAGESSGPLIR